MNVVERNATIFMNLLIEAANGQQSKRRCLLLGFVASKTMLLW